jgi:ATP-dependent Clp protease protease subunit
MNARKLLQLIKDNARADGAAKPIRLEASAGQAHIYVTDVIDPYWGASAADLIAALAQADGQDVTMHINSPGGDVFESLAMAAAVSAHTGKVTAVVEGLAASAATRLALSAAEVHITDGSLFMVHNSWTMAWGNKTELRSTADLLDKVDAGIVADYARKTGATTAQVQAWMDAETWFTAAEAQAAGFADQVLVSSQAAGKTSAQASAARWNLSAYGNAPKLQPPADQPDAAAIAAQAASTARLNRARLALVSTPN